MTTYTADIEIRFRDIDAMGHVNNAVYATYVEQARARYFADVLDTDLSSISSVLASLSIQFRRPIELDERRVTVSVDVDELGRSSIRMSYEVRASGEVAAEADSTQVLIDPETGDSRRIPDPIRERIAEYHDW